MLMIEGLKLFVSSYQVLNYKLRCSSYTQNQNIHHKYLLMLTLLDEEAIDKRFLLK